MSGTVTMVITLNDARLLYKALVDRSDDIRHFDPIQADDLLTLAREIATDLPIYIRPGNAFPTTRTPQ